MNFKFLLFVGIIFLILFIVKVYAYRRILRHHYFFQKRRWVAIVLLIALSIGELGLFVIKDSKMSAIEYILFGSSVVLTYCLFFAVFFSDIIRIIISFLQSLFYTKSVNATPKYTQIESKSRRNFLKILYDLGFVALFFLLSMKSYANALQIPKIREVRVKLNAMRGKKSIALISDVHIGKALGGEFLRGLVDRINTLNADIVVIVGDLVDDAIENVKDDLLILNELRSKEGVFYVAGNHEYYHGIEPIVGFLGTLNLTILHNRNIELESFNLAGVSDLAGERFGILQPDLEAAKMGLNREKPSILLSHQPKFVRRNDMSDFDLVLCGHTHAGQVFPLSFFVWLDQHYVHGLYDIDSKSKVYVSSGAGFWGPPIRFLASSEIAHIIVE